MERWPRPVAGDDGELSGGDQLAEDLLHTATAETGSLLEGQLVGSPLAVLVAVDSDDEQDGEGRTGLARVIEDGGHVLMAHGWLLNAPEDGGGVALSFDAFCADRDKHVKRFVVDVDMTIA